MFWLMIFGLFIFTLGQFIPIYFSDIDFRIYFYPLLLILTTIAVAFVMYRNVYLPNKSKMSYPMGLSFITTFIVFLVLALITIGKMLVVWTDIGPIYLMKNDPNVQITSRYINEGAFGGGTEPDDYQMVVKRPFTPFFNIETSVDTNKIDKSKWIRQNPF